MDAGTRGRNFWSLAAGVTVFVLTLLMLGIALLLIAASPTLPDFLNGRQISVELLGFATVGAILAAFALATVAYREDYLATLWATAPFIPGVAAAAVFISFLTLPAAPGGLSHGLAALCVGTGAAVAVWIVSAAPLRSLSCVATAQTYSYLWLQQRTTKLKAVIEGIETAKRSDDEKRHRTAALREAKDYVRRLERELGTDDDRVPDGSHSAASGLRYVSATGYLDLWRLVYRAEEAVITLDDVQATDSAIYDALRLESATIPNRWGLRAKLKFALAAVNPAAGKYLETPSDLAGIQAEKAQADSQHGKSILPDVKASKEEIREAGLAVIRVVRQAINESRDTQWVGIVRARNRLLRTSLFTGLFAFLLLAMSVVIGVPQNLLAGAVAFYLAGALVGLIARLRAEAHSNSATDDYGLFEARLIQTPLLSGLAAVAGVFVVAVGTPLLAPGNTTVSLISLPDIFDLSKNMIGLLSAAVFGLTPELLLKELQAYGDKRIQDLNASQTTTPGSTATE